MTKKEEVVAYAKAHSIYQASQHFKLSAGTIGPWMKIDFSKVKATVFRTPGSGRKLTYPMEKEQELVQWVLEQRDLHLAVSVQSLMDKAAEIITPTVSDFMASRGWAQKFMRRNDIVIRAKTTIAQKLPAALEEKMSKFHSAVQEAVKKNQYPLELIGNMDETPMYFDMASNTTIEKKGTKSVSIRTTGAEKRHLTVVLAASADGSMLPPFVIFKGKRKLKNLSVPKGWVVTVQQKGWMDADLMKQWIQEIWLKYTGRKNALLVMDSFSAHCTEEIQDLLSRNNTDIALIPGGCTSKLQPLDVSLNRPFKSICRSEFAKFCRSQLSTATDPANRLKTASKQEVLNWLQKAQAYLTFDSPMVAGSFKVTGISTAANGSEDHLIRNPAIQPQQQDLHEDSEEDPFEEDFDPFIDLVD